MPKGTISELYPMYDSRRSFYHKAVIVCDIESHKETLYSYKTPVVIYDTKHETIELLDAYNCSMTTRRHVREYIRQLGLEPHDYNL